MLRRVVLLVSFALVAVARADEPVVPAPTARERAIFDLLTLYKDNYFLTGFSEDHQVKFQFSVKFDLWPNEGPHGVYFGFSERSRWNLFDASAPFVENNYNPELFYTYYHHERRYDPEPGCGFFRSRLGVEHESDGVGAGQSRGWNRIYVSSRYACMDARERYALVDLKVWAPPFGDSDNPDITRFYGYGELAFSVGADAGPGHLNRADLTVRVRKGFSDWDTGSVEVDGKWTPPYPESWRFTPHLYVQLFYGQGETLLLYNETQTSFRVGVGFSDRSTRSR